MFRKPFCTFAVCVHKWESCLVSINATIFFLLSLLLVVWRVLFPTCLPRWRPTSDRSLYCALRKHRSGDAAIVEITFSPPTVVRCRGLQSLAGIWRARALFTTAPFLFTCLACIARFRFITPFDDNGSMASVRGLLAFHTHYGVLCRVVNAVTNTFRCFWTRGTSSSRHLIYSCRISWYFELGCTPSSR